MSGVTAAVIGAGVLGAGASIYGADTAAGAVKSSTSSAVNAENSALTSAETITSPYRNLGQSAIPQLQALLGIGSGAGNSQAELTALQQTPGYQFTLQQGLQGTQNAATAAGMLNSGNTLEALDNYSSGLADQTYQQAVQNAENTVGLGANAATNTASQITNTGSQVGSQIAGAGQSLAGLDTNLAATLAGLGGNAASAYTLNNTLQNLSLQPVIPTAQYMNA